MTGALALLLLPLVLGGPAAPAPLDPGVERIDGAALSPDGLHIRYHVLGGGSPPIVFVHGWACDSSFWDAQVRHFANTHRVVALDLAGHGGSGRGRKSWTVGAFAADVGAVLAALDLKGAVLVGHSMGGPVIVETARRYPDRVAALVPVDTFMSVTTKSSKRDWDAFIATLRADFRKAAADLVRKGMFLASSDRALVEHVVARVTAMPPGIGVAVMDGLWSYDASAALASVKLPIRCINSDRKPTQLAEARRFAPQLEAVIVKGVGHFVMLEDPEGFNRLLEQAILELAPPSPQ